MEKKSYQVLARRYRPQTFSEVVGQESVITTLRHAIAHQRLAQAYLFSGARGTGKTTLARVLAKALNCESLTTEGEPCCLCSSCLEIASGNSLDVLEIDGASHRGIEDVRQMNDTVTFTPSSGKYKIYIIDEVHMLTKEAFNALLKTLEEPPSHVKFFFATTELHKVLPTIISRCQCFSLRRIPAPHIVQKLRSIADEIGVTIEDEALRHIAHRADGGLRDAESLFEQVATFSQEKIGLETIHEVLGTLPRDGFFLFEEAIEKKNWAFAFKWAEEIFKSGKEMTSFFESLLDHYRTLLLYSLSPSDDSFHRLTQEEKEHYKRITKRYSKEQLTGLLDELLALMNQHRAFPFGQMSIEIALLRIMRSRYRVSLASLVDRLEKLEGNLSPEEKPTKPLLPPSPPVVAKESFPEAMGARLPKEAEEVIQADKGWHDTLLEFAAVELGGTLERTGRR